MPRGRKNTNSAPATPDSRAVTATADKRGPATPDSRAATVTKEKISKSAPATPKKVLQPLIGPISIGAGMTAGLEIWRQGTQMVLVDSSVDGRFADDVVTWTNILSR